MKLRDILTPEEDTRVQHLLIELLEAHNKKESALINAEIEEIYNTAKERYYAMNAKNEQASSVQTFIRPTLNIRMKMVEQELLQ